MVSRKGLHPGTGKKRLLTSRDMEKAIEVGPSTNRIGPFTKEGIILLLWVIIDVAAGSFQ